MEHLLLQDIQDTQDTQDIQDILCKGNVGSKDYRINGSIHKCRVPR